MTEQVKTTGLIKALAKALPQVDGAQKDKANPQFRGSKYADLGSVIDAIRPVAEHGLWFRQSPIEKMDGACIETFYVHESGEEMSAGQCFVPANKKDAQGYGSAMTYARRYGLLAAFGIAPEDDDGNAASKKQEPPKPITDAQLAELQALLTAANVSAQVVCESFNVPSLDKLNTEQWQTAISRTNTEIEKRKNG